MKKQILWRTLIPKASTLNVNIKIAWVSSRQHFRGVWWKGFLVDSRYSNGNKLRSSSRHISLLILNGIYTVFALTRKKTVGISFQLHIHKQPRFWELPVPKVSCWTWNQRHDREQLLCFLPGFTPVDREGLSTWQFNLYDNVTISIFISQTFRFWVAIFHFRPPIAFLSQSLYDMPGIAPHMDVLFWGQRDFPISFSNIDTSRNASNWRWGSSMDDTGIL